MSGPTLSLVVRTRARGDEPLGLLAAVAHQVRPPDEVVLIDSGSSAGLLSEFERLARDGLRGPGGARIPVRLLQLAPAAYTSAGALNVAIGETRGEHVAILSQDAVPASSDYLARLHAALADPRLAGAYGRQVPGPGASPLAAKDLARSYPGRSRTQELPDSRFVNTCSMIRRALWEACPFDGAAGIAEDHGWARAMQQRGHAVRYEAGAVVRHHHDYPRVRDLWDRFYDEGRGIGFVYDRAPRLSRAVRDALREAASDALWLIRRGRASRWPEAALRRTVKHAALYCGLRRYRADATGRIAQGSAISK